MMSGIGFEGEDPRTLGFRTMVFAFLLVCSRQICDIGLSLGAAVVDLLQIPSSVILPSLTEDMFSIDASWFLMLIVGIIILFQLVKFFLEVGERYVIVGVLTILSPLAFAMGGSKNTMEIFKGWVRMYASMCLMLVMNVVFMKMIISAMAVFPRGLMVFPWLILIIALARVARKIDSIIARIGLNPAITGDGLGRGLPGMMAMMVGRNLASGVVNSKLGRGDIAASSVPAKRTWGAATRCPMPVNTNTAGGVSPRTADSGFTGNANPVAAGATNLVGGSPASVNPPIGRSGAESHGKTNRAAGIQPSAVHNGKAARGCIPVSVDKPSTHNTPNDSNVSKPPHSSGMRAANSATPPDTRKRAELTGVQSTGGHDNPPRPPRGSGDIKPFDTTGTIAGASIFNGGASLKSAAPESSRPTPSTSEQQTGGAGTAAQSTSIRSGGASPVQTSQSTHQGARAQVNAAASQGGTQVQQNIQQNTQNLTRAGSSPQPVWTQAVGGASAGKQPSASRQAAASVHVPASTATAGKSAAKTQTPKPAPKAAPGAAAQTPKTIPKPLDLRAQGKQPKIPEPKQKKSPNTPKAGKNKTPAPLDIGTSENVGDSALGVPPDDPKTVTDHEQ